MAEIIQKQKIIKIENLGEEYDDEMEQILIKNGVCEDELVYKDSNFSSISFSSKEEEINWIRNNAFLFKDENYYYIVAEDSCGDYSVERKNLHNDYFDAVEVKV